MMKTKFHEKLRLLTFTGVLTALTAAATMLIRIPTPTKGYLNLGDTLVNLSAWLLGPVYGAAAGGIGSALADLLSGYAVYCPATLVIKCLMGLAAWGVWHLLAKRGNIKARITAAIVSELVMIVGYAVFEGFLYGSAAQALLSVSGNLVQGIFGASCSVLLYETLLRHLPIPTKR